jgi:hypothetical protein
MNVYVIFFNLALVAVGYALTVALVLGLLFTVARSMRFRPAPDGGASTRLIAVHSLVWFTAAAIGGALVSIFGVGQPAAFTLLLALLLFYAKWRQAQRDSHIDYLHELLTASAAAAGVLAAGLLVHIQHWQINLPIQF